MMSGSDEEQSPNQDEGENQFNRERRIIYKDAFDSWDVSKYYSVRSLFEAVILPQLVKKGIEVCLSSFNMTTRVNQFLTSRGVS